MNREEFNAWKQVTQASRDRWLLDTVILYNQETYLYYHGGTDGQYIQIEKDGAVEVGTYEGALPCITDAAFTPRSRKQVAQTAHGARQALSAFFRREGMDDLALAIEQPEYAHA